MSSIISNSVTEVTAILMARETRIVLYTCVVLMMLLAFMVGLKYYLQSEDNGLGQQFEQTDVQDSADGMILPINAACAKSDEIVVGLFDEGFEIYSMGSSEDIKGNVFMMTFWKKMMAEGYTVVITSSFDKQGMTCIVSITKNVRDLQTNGQNVAPSVYEPAENEHLLVL